MMTNVGPHQILSNSHFTQHSSHLCCLVSCIVFFSHLTVNENWRSSEQVKGNPSLVEFGTNAYPLKSLSGVLDCVSDATVKSQWPRQSIQVIEELFILLCKVVSHLPVLIAVQDTVSYVQVICCHLVDALGDAYKRGGGAAPV